MSLHAVMVYHFVFWWWRGMEPSQLGYEGLFGGRGLLGPGRRASSAMSRLLAPPSWGHRGRAPWPHLCHTYTVSPWSRYGGAWIKGELIGKA